MKEELTYKIRRWWGSDAPYLSDQTFMERDQEAIKLLPVLVERGFSPCLFYSLASTWNLEICFNGDKIAHSQGCCTISQAITGAVLEVINGAS